MYNVVLKFKNQRTYVPMKKTIKFKNRRTHVPSKKRTTLEHCRTYPAKKTKSCTLAQGEILKTEPGRARVF